MSKPYIALTVLVLGPVAAFLLYLGYEAVVALIHFLINPDLSVNWPVVVLVIWMFLVIVWMVWTNVTDVF